MGEQRVPQGLRRAVGEQVVGIAELDEGMPRLRDGAVGRVRDTMIFLFDDRDVGPARGVRLEDGQRVVRRAVVDEDVLALEVAALRGDPVQNVRQPGGLVEDGHDEGHAGHVTDSRSSWRAGTSHPAA